MKKFDLTNEIKQAIDTNNGKPVHSKSSRYSHTHREEVKNQVYLTLQTSPFGQYPKSLMPLENRNGASMSTNIIYRTLVIFWIMLTNANISAQLISLLNSARQKQQCEISKKQSLPRFRSNAFRAERQHSPLHSKNTWIIFAWVSITKGAYNTWTS